MFRRADATSPKRWALAPPAVTPPSQTTPCPPSPVICRKRVADPEVLPNDRPGQTPLMSTRQPPTPPPPNAQQLATTLHNKQYLSTDFNAFPYPYNAATAVLPLLLHATQTVYGTDTGRADEMCSRRSSRSVSSGLMSLSLTTRSAAQTL